MKIPLVFLYFSKNSFSFLDFSYNSFSFYILVTIPLVFRF